jgi:hypothetical protein
MSFNTDALKLVLLVFDSGTEESEELICDKYLMINSPTNPMNSIIVIKDG